MAGLLRRNEKESSELFINGYDVHGVTTTVSTNSDTAAKAISGFLKGFKPAKPGDTDIKFHLFIVDDLQDDIAPTPEEAAMLYDWGAVKVFHDGDCRHLKVDSRARVIMNVESSEAVGFAEKDLLQSDWLITNLVFYPLWAQLLKENGLFPLHAAGLDQNGKTSLFLGKSGSGKSTLSLNMVKGGCGILSDDTIFLREKDGKVEALAFPEEINVSEQTIELLPELSKVKEYKLNTFRQKSSFSIEELYPERFVYSSEPVLMVFPEITDAEETVVKKISKTEALTLSLRYGFFFLDPSSTKKHFEVLSLLAKQVKCYRMYSGNNQDMLNEAIYKLMAEAL